jgi:hypothetical protein
MILGLVVYNWTWGDWVSLFTTEYDSDCDNITLKLILCLKPTWMQECTTELNTLLKQSRTNLVEFTTELDSMLSNLGSNL